MAVAEIPTGVEIVTRKERSLFQQSMQRLLQNKIAVASLIFLIILFIIAFIIAPFTNVFLDPLQQDLTANNAVPEWMLFLLPPGAENYATINNTYILGADHLGRDVLSRTMNGARISLSVAIVASTVSLVIGTVYGLISGYSGGRTDSIMMRIVDFIYGFPFLIVVILMQAFFKAQARQGATGMMGAMVSINDSMGGMFFLFIAIGLVNWIGMARIARGQVLSQKKKEYVEAAESIGASETSVMGKHILPNILGPLIVAETLAIPGYIFTEAFLSFIGLGVDPPTPSWGIMISEAARGIRSYPNQVLVPAIMLSVTTLAFNFLGDGLRDAFDPRMKQ
ncbi:MAG: ABC transporter permease [Candidatus Promineifilaceae bacterium]|nr:ABC transporter permease [Candidatus Promineifilaceae bacterium]